MTKNPKTLMPLGVLSLLLTLGTTGLVFGQVISGTISGTVSGGPGLGVQRPELPSGVVSGTVVDERGAPMTRAMVYVLGSVAMAGGRTMEMSRSMPTDEGGRFRIDRLQAQSYVVAVALLNTLRVTPPGMRPAAAVVDQPVYPLTYFPGTIDRAQAQPVAVGAGGEQSVFIEVQPVMPVHVRGSVSSPSGRSTSGIQLQLQRTIGSSGSSSMGGYVQADGTFDIAVAPGNYTLVANVSPGPIGGEFATAEIKATGDVNGVALLLGTGGTVHGRIVFDGPSPGPAPLGAAISISSMPGSPMMGRPFGPVPVAEDWTFEATGLYGTYRFSPSTILMTQYRQGRVEVDGREIANNNGMNANGIEIRDGEHQVVVHLVQTPPRPVR